MGHRVAAAGSVLIVARLFTRGIDLVTLLVLGRLLSPADFGLVAIAMSVMMVVEAVTDLPIMNALARLRTATKDYLDTAFTISALRATAVAATLVALAWPMAVIYRDDRLIALICVLAIAPVSRSFASAALADLVRELEYRNLLLLELVGKLVGLVLAIGVAASTRSYWALAAGTIAAPLVGTIGSYIVAPYRPSLMLRQWHAFAGFFGWASVSQAVAALNWQLDQLLLGRLVSSFELGRFSMANNLASLPTQTIVTQLVGPLLVAFSRIREDKDRLRDAYQSSATTLVAIGLPAMIGLSLIADPLIRLVLGEQWHESAPILSWLSLSMIPALFVSPLGSLAMSLGQTKVLARVSVVELLIKASLLAVAAVHYGIAGVIAARLVTATLMAGYGMLMVRMLIGLSLQNQIVGPWRQIASCGIMAIAVFPCARYLSDIHSPAGLIVGTGLTVALGALVYAAAIFLLWRLAGRPDGLEPKAVHIMTGLYRSVRARFSSRV